MLKRVGPTVVAIALLSALGMMGCGGSSFLGSENVTETPTFSPGGGTYNVPRAVNITDTTSGAVIYCTTDGTTPTTSSPKCAQPTTVYQTEFLQAIAVAPGKNLSTVAAAAYTINLNAAATPTFSPSGGTYVSAQQVTIADAIAGANIYYTTDGSVPTTASTQYTGPVTVSKSQTLNAIATASGYANSGIASAAYTINQPVALPVFSVSSGNYTSTQKVALSDATPNAAIYYAINNGAPSSSSTQYTGPITVSQTETISAIAVLGGGNSAIVTAAYTINLPQPPPAPVFYPTSDSSVVQGQQVSIIDGDTKASIYYTIDGSTPTASSTLYTASGFTFSTLGAVTIKAVAIDGGSSSPVATATYTVGAATVPAPKLSLASGSSITTAEVVTITDGDGNATIYYTANGSTPTASSTPYAAPGITFSTPDQVTVKAVAIDSGANSPVATATYNVFPPGTSFSGTVLSGTRPVNGAQVLLYAAGQSGYGSYATALSEAVTTDSSGAFTMKNSGCPASPNDLVYLVATGGDTGNGPNSKLEFMTALGPCGKLTSSTNVIVNEITTVASAYALGQFMTAAPNVGSSSTNYQGLSNAFATISNLVDITKGEALSITPDYATNTVSYLNSSTAPQARVNTLASMLNGCADSNGAGAACSNLLSNATPASGTAPANTLQAILNIAQNPGTNVSSLFALASSTGPFQPVLSIEPNDLTLALTFTGAGLGIAPNSTVALSPGSPTPLAIINTSLAVDSLGNVWVTAYADNNPSSPSYSNSQDTIVAGFSSTGAPLTPATSLSADSTPLVTFGGFNPEPGTGLTIGTIAIDPVGNLWLGDDSTEGNIVKVGTGSGMSVLVPPQNTGNRIYSAAVDSSGNAWFGGNGSIFEFKNDGTKILSSNGASSLGGATYQELAYLAFDANGGLWGSDFLVPTLYQISTSDGTITSNLFPGGAAFTPLTLTGDGSGNIYVCGDPGGQTLDVFNAGSETGSYLISTSRGCGEQLLLDGQGHFFAVNDGLSYPGGAGIDEFTISSGQIQLISPVANGYTGTSSGEPPTIITDSNAVNSFFLYLYPTSAAIDGSGNLWVLNADTNSSASPGNVLVEFVGIAAPVVTPISMGQPGVRP